MTKGRRRKFGGRARTGAVFIRGDLALLLKGQRRLSTEREVIGRKAFAQGLIRRYLEAGVLQSGMVIERNEGTPQGGPLSPLLANVLLDKGGKELEKRGYAFVRYADDCNVYVASKRAGKRVMALLRSSMEISSSRSTSRKARWTW